MKKLKGTKVSLILFAIGYSFLLGYAVSKIIPLVVVAVVLIIASGLYPIFLELIDFSEYPAQSKKNSDKD